MKLSLCSEKKPFGHPFYNRHSLRDLGGGLGGGLGGRHGGRRQQRGNGGVCNCHRQQRPRLPVRPSSQLETKTEFNAIPSDKTVERRGRISSARETICGGDGGRIKTGEWRGRRGKARSLSPCRRARAGLRSKSSRSKFAGGKKETNTDAKGARRSRDHARNEG